MNDLATEQGRFYWPDGRPAYTIIGKNGKERATHVGDARKLDLRPSVTTISRMLAAPALNLWMQNEAIWAALTLPRLNGESDESFVARVKVDSKERARKAAERGTALHADIERALRGEPHGHQEHIKKIWAEVDSCAYVTLNCDCLVEHTFAHPDGFAGKIDFTSDDVVIDFKSKATIEDGKQLVYDEHVIQLGAYAYGLGIKEPFAYNVFVGIDDCKVVVHQWSADEIKRGQRIFKHLLAIWREKNRWI